MRRSSSSASAEAAGAAEVGSAAAGTFRKRSRQLGQDRIEQRDEVDRVTPGVALLAALAAAESADQAREHRRRLDPGAPIEQLERLVDEVDGVPTGEEVVVGRRGEQQVRDRGRILAVGDGGEERPLGAFLVAHLDELPKPGLQLIQRYVARGQRIEHEAGRPAGAVARDVHQPMIQRERAPPAPAGLERCPYFFPCSMQGNPGDCQRTRGIAKYRPRCAAGGGSSGAHAGEAAQCAADAVRRDDGLGRIPQGEVSSNWEKLSHHTPKRDGTEPITPKRNSKRRLIHWNRRVWRAVP